MRRVRAAILVVDDDPSVRAVVSLILELEGHRVVTAHDVPSALELVSKDEPLIDLLVADMCLPGGNAPALVRGLEQMGLRLPVLYLSGYGRPEEALPGRESLYLTKPFVPNRLASAVLSLL